ncbi:putative secreted protein [Alloactinosynnema sp. L-07]|uniref:class F sortase n=1 Tax=Alloactinosynnema sp. L-07 TaxID=1653480 RepID=UPI00065EF566|nr:class F sortase [Alloactinosynnema sp. L-07]CRK57972.1 putative secreted protein [Alloactinosynnema sp. L-07]
MPKFGRQGGRRVVAAALLFALVAGCEATASVDPAPPTTTSTSAPAGPTTTTTTTGLGRSTPNRVEIPRIGATSTLTSLGLNPDQTVEVPPLEQRMQAGWYSKGPTPGEVGPAVVLGHVDGQGKPGIFFRLRELRPGDEILISREDGGKLTFVVERVQQVAKAEFPSDEVYGDTARPELRLITCGGTFDRAAKSYRDNTIIYAALKGEGGP